MRKDMAKVIVERPRRGGDGRVNRRPIPWEDAPKQESVGRSHVLTGRDKSLSDNLAPLRRYLERQVGRPWNKVYSEICAKLRRDSPLQRHLLSHIEDFVAIK